ncbi:MAG TPA: hypothetical protein VHJ20_11385 [Polyangia bacterium]|nr:hypothetical protein [Polyangia bacterium]
MDNDDVAKMETKVEEARRELTVVVDELGRRRRRMQTPIVAAAAVGTAALVTVGVIAWRRHRRKTRPRFASLTRALRRAAAHPERVAEGGPSIGKKVLMSAAATAASFAVRALIQRATQPDGRRSTTSAGSDS